MTPLETLRERIRAFGSESSARLARRYFKTGPGDYGEGDLFLGVSVPRLRALLPGASELGTGEVEELLHSEWHEERLFALLLLVLRFQRTRGEEGLRDQLAGIYLRNLRWVNNWDLVDSSAPQILGNWLSEKDRSVLDTLAVSPVMWERRVAIVSTLAFIREGELEWTFRLVRVLLGDSQDLMHKACGWMLREAYKKQADEVLLFLEQHGPQMPRTMLRYAIERAPIGERKRLLLRYR
jgi:3-methyladenine DNA glycosylase AlkD